MTLTLRRKALSVAPLDFVSDSFTRADSASSAGTTDSYNGGTATAWTAWNAAVFGISSNQLYLPTAVSDGYLTVDTGSTAMEVSAKITTRPNSNNMGIVAGFSDANNYILFQINNAGVAQFYRRSAGSFVTIAGSTTTPVPAVAAGDVIGIRLEPMPNTAQDGLFITYTINGVVVVQASVTGLTLGTKAGFREDGASTWRADNFRAAPIVPRPTLARTASPVLSPAGPELGCYNPEVRYMDGQYVMCYSPDLAAGLSTSLAYSTDLVTWTKEPNNPILSPITAEHAQATNGSVVKLGSTYYCYYQAIDGSAVVNIYVATASALAGPWTRQGMVMANSADPSVRLLPDGVTLEMWYLRNQTFIGKATSTDGLAYTDLGQKFKPPLTYTNAWGEPSVYVDGSGRIHMFWCGATSGGYRSIHEAISSDSGTTWVNRMYRMPKGPGGGFDSAQVFDPSPVIVDNTLYLFYAGSQVAGGGGGLGACAVGLAIGPAY